MLSPRWFIVLAVLPILAIGWLLMAFIDPDGPKRSTEYITLGHLFGAMFGQTSVAAAWAAFGPGRWYARLPLGFGWLALLIGALSINMGLYRSGPDDFLGILFLCLLGQWLLVQIPLWVLALMYGLRMAHASDLRDDRGADDLLALPQFGIRQLMILTAVVAVVLGVLRAMVLTAGQQFSNSSDSAAFIFLAIAAVVMTLPLVMAALLPRWWLPATCVVLIGGALATLTEFPLSQVAGLRGGGPDAQHFIWINAFTALWVLLPLCLARLTGYTLTNRPAHGDKMAAASPFALPVSASKSHATGSDPSSPWATPD
jgi:hypothetical protein